MLETSIPALDVNRYHALLMQWLLKLPMHQQAWYWLVRTDNMYWCLNSAIKIWLTPYVTFTRDHSGYGRSQLEMPLQCNIVSHWLNPYPDWSLFHSCPYWWCLPPETLQPLPLPLIPLILRNFFVTKVKIRTFSITIKMKSANLESDNEFQ